MNIVILGPQGSGKGTQAKLIAARLNLFYLETGKMSRELAERDSRVDEIVNKKGELLPDEEIFSYVANYIDEKNYGNKNIIFDGFPRSVKQYELLKNWLKTKNIRIDTAILLNISEGESIRRLSARRVCEKCGINYNLITKPPPPEGCKCGGNLIHREDDKQEAIKRRLSLYKRTTHPLIDIFKKEGILMEVDGERPIETIFKDILIRLGLKND